VQQEKQENPDKSKAELFLSKARHKIKGPLTTIHLYTEALLSGSVGKISKEQKDYLDEIYKATKKIINDINDLSKSIEDGKE